MGAGAIIRAHQYCTKVSLNTVAMMIKMVMVTMVMMTSPAHERSIRARY